MSAIDENGADGPTPVIRVLFTLHPGFDILDFTGPLEVLSHARHNIKDASSKAFKCEFVSGQEHTLSAQGCSIRAHMDFDDAHEDLGEYDVLVVPGGNTDKTLEGGEEAEPQKLIKAFAELQKSDPTKERTLLTICTGSLFAAQTGILQGLAITTHPDFYTKLEIVCQQAARRGNLEQSDVMEERYVVNNARFDLGENEDENPFVLKKKPDGRRKSIARKGSNAWQEGNRRRESIVRRANLRLGGLRVITAGGIASGLDAALYLVGAMVSHESAEEVGRVMQYTWVKGVTVDGIDV